MLAIRSASSPESGTLIRNFLQQHHSGVLATADNTGKPHGATVYFSVDDTFCLVFATKTQTQKYKNIKENSRAAFVCSDESTNTTVQIEGVVEESSDPNVHQAAMNAMYTFSAQGKTNFPPLEKIFAGDYVTITLIPSMIKMGIFMRPDAESNEELYEVLHFVSE